MRMVDIPPDATVFRGPGGTLCYLYMGALELAALQREWGVSREPGETDEAWEKKNEAFNARLNGGMWADRVTIMRVCLSRWAKQEGGAAGPIQLDDLSAAVILEAAERPNAKPTRRAGSARMGDLWLRFVLDMLGVGKPEEVEEEDEDAPKAEGASTPNGSPQRVSAGASREKKHGASRRGRSASSPVPAGSPT